MAVTRHATSLAESLLDMASIYFAHFIYYTVASADIFKLLAAFIIATAADTPSL